MCLASRNEASRIALLFLRMRCGHYFSGIENTQVTWKFGRYGEAIIRASASDAWMITFLVERHICSACRSILVLTSSWLHSRSSINLLEPSVLMQMHCSWKATYNFAPSMIKLCLSYRDTKNTVNSALLFRFERKAPHCLIWDEPAIVSNFNLQVERFPFSAFFIEFS